MKHDPCSAKILITQQVLGIKLEPLILVLFMPPFWRALGSHSRRQTLALNSGSFCPLNNVLRSISHIMVSNDEYEQFISIMTWSKRHHNSTGSLVHQCWALSWGKLSRGLGKQLIKSCSCSLIFTESTPTIRKWYIAVQHLTEFSQRTGWLPRDLDKEYLVII